MTERDYRSKWLDEMAHITKRGGYEEIPSDVVKSAAEDLGIKEKDIPEIKVVRDLKRGYIHTEPSGKVVIAIPRRESRRTISKTLRHELAHYKLGHAEADYKDSPERQAREEVAVHSTLADDKLSGNEICDIVQSLMLDFDLPKTKALNLVFKEARSQGVENKKAFNEAREFYKYRPTYFKDWWTSRDREIVVRRGKEYGLTEEDIPPNVWEKILKGEYR